MRIANIVRSLGTKLVSTRKEKLPAMCNPGDVIALYPSKPILKDGKTLEKLSPLDLAAMKLFMTYQVVYDGWVDPKVVSESFQHLLSVFPQLGGKIVNRYQLDQVYQLAIEYEKPSVEFVFKKWDSQSLVCPNQSESMFRSQIRDCLYMLPLKLTLEEHDELSPMRLSLIHFQNQKSVLSIDINHSILDGIAFSHVLNTWIDILNDGHVKNEPVYQREHIIEMAKDEKGEYSLSELDKQHFSYFPIWSFIFNNFTYFLRPSLFFRTNITKDSIRELKELVNHRIESDMNVTSNDLICSIFWKYLMQDGSKDEKVSIHIPFNFRSHTNLSPFFFGNAVETCKVCMTRRELSSTSISDIAKVIHSGLQKYKSQNHVRSVIKHTHQMLIRDGIEDYMTSSLLIPDLNDVFLTTNTTMYNFANLDFGVGKPSYYFKPIEPFPNCTVISHDVTIENQRESPFLIQLYGRKEKHKDLHGIDWNDLTKLMYDKHNP